MALVRGQDPANLRLEKLRRYRNRPERDLSLAFMQDQFKREVARPYKQLQSIAELWQALLPPALIAQSRLDSLVRGVLHVSVASSAALYELDRALRGGLQQELISRHKGPALRKIQLRVAPIE